MILLIVKVWIEVVCLRDKVINESFEVEVVGKRMYDENGLVMDLELIKNILKSVEMIYIDVYNDNCINEE